MSQSHQPYRCPFTIVVLAVFSCAAFALAGPPPNDYDFDFVTVGAVGNAPYSGDSEGGNAGRGQVNYEYRIARMEVTTAQWMEFVNTFSVQGNDIAGPGRIFSWGAVVDNTYNGPGRRYKLNPAAPNAALYPVFGINWRDCAQFVNWLNNDKSPSPEALTHGAYDTSSFTQNPNNSLNDQLFHDPDAKYWIPTLDEWLKAAHYDPDRYGQGQEGWWEYSTMSDTPPIPGFPGVGQTSAGDPQGLGEPSRLSIPLGAYPDTVSPWGLLDASGGSVEWLEEPFSPSFLTSRGAAGSRAGSTFSDMLYFDHAGAIDGGIPSLGGGRFGLRIASSVPLPGAAPCLFIALQLTTHRRRNKP